MLDFGTGARFPGVRPGPATFVSRDIAETHARAFLALANRKGRTLLDHVGAFPEGERVH